MSEGLDSDLQALSQSGEAGVLEGPENMGQGTLFSPSSAI